jgi:hypothetical protein
MPPEYVLTRRVCGIGQAHGRESGVDALASLPPRHVEQLGEQQHVLPASERRVRREQLRDVADHPPNPHGRGSGIRSEYRDLPSGGLEQRGQHPDRRRLPGAIRPEQPVRLSGRYLQVQMVDSDVVAEPVGQARAADGRLRRRIAFRPQTRDRGC